MSGPDPAHRRPPGLDDATLEALGKLSEALEALSSDPVLCDAFGRDFIAYFTRIKQSEQQRFDAAEDPDDFHRREYFSRI